MDKLKRIIRSYTKEKNVSLKSLSQSTDMNYYFLIFLLYFPFAKVKLTQGVSICKALDIKVSELFWHPDWHTYDTSYLNMLPNSNGM